MDDVQDDEKARLNTHAAQNGMSGFLWMLGVIGAAVHYIQAADGFGAGFVGFLKALVWPAFLVYELLRFLGA